jgi:hypothetical protein
MEMCEHEREGIRGGSQNSSSLSNIFLVISWRRMTYETRSMQGSNEQITLTSRVGCVYDINLDMKEIV